VFIFPAEGRLAAFTVDVRDGVQTRQQDPLLGGAAAHVYSARGTPNYQLTRKKKISGEPKKPKNVLAFRNKT
jgi:hypothetical protein